MTFKDLVLANRSYRRFDGAHAVDGAELRELVGLARTTPSGGNLQPLKYVLSCSAEGNALVYDTLAWATYLPEWKGPPVHERPTAYVVVLRDLAITQTARVQVSDIDLGIAAQTILLGAIERGLGGCMFASMKREELARRWKRSCSTASPRAVPSSTGASRMGPTTCPSVAWRSRPPPADTVPQRRISQAATATPPPAAMPTTISGSVWPTMS